MVFFELVAMIDVFAETCRILLRKVDPPDIEADPRFDILSATSLDVSDAELTERRVYS